MMTFEKVLEVFNDYLNKDSVLEVVNTKRGYTVMIWDEKDEQWFGVEHCKAPELLRDALLDGYRDFLEQQLTHKHILISRRLSLPCLTYTATVYCISCCW